MGAPCNQAHVCIFLIYIESETIPKSAESGNCENVVVEHRGFYYLLHRRQRYSGMPINLITLVAACGILERQSCRRRQGHFHGPAASNQTEMR